jgi:hypothetical protein
MEELEELETVEARHPDIGQHDIRTPIVEPSKRRRGILCNADVAA